MNTFVFVVLLVLTSPIWATAFLSNLLLQYILMGWEMAEHVKEWMIGPMPQADLIGRKLTECPQCHEKAFSKLWGDCEECNYTEPTP